MCKVNIKTRLRFFCSLCPKVTPRIQDINQNLEFECSFRFLEMPYFVRQGTISTLSAQPTLVSELPLQLGPRGSQSAVEH